MSSFNFVCRPARPYYSPPLSVVSLDVVCGSVYYIISHVKVTKEILICVKVTNGVPGCVKVTMEQLDCVKLTMELLGCVNVTAETLGFVNSIRLDEISILVKSNVIALDDDHLKGTFCKLGCVKFIMELLDCVNVTAESFVFINVAGMNEKSILNISNIVALDEGHLKVTFCRLRCVKITMGLLGSENVNRQSLRFTKVTRLDEMKIIGQSNVIALNENLSKDTFYKSGGVKVTIERLGCKNVNAQSLHFIKVTRFDEISQLNVIALDEDHLKVTFFRLDYIKITTELLGFVKVTNVLIDSILEKSKDITVGEGCAKVTLCRSGYVTVTTNYISIYSNFCCRKVTVTCVIFVRQVCVEVRCGCVKLTFCRSSFKRAVEVCVKVTSRLGCVEVTCTYAAYCCVNMSISIFGGLKSTFISILDTWNVFKLILKLDRVTLGVICKKLPPLIMIESVHFYKSYVIHSSFINAHLNIKCAKINFQCSNNNGRCSKSQLMKELCCDNTNKQCLKNFYSRVNLSSSNMDSDRHVQIFDHFYGCFIFFVYLNMHLNYYNSERYLGSWYKRLFLNTFVTMTLLRVKRLGRKGLLKAFNSCINVTEVRLNSKTTFMYKASSNEVCSVNLAINLLLCAILNVNQRLRCQKCPMKCYIIVSYLGKLHEFTRVKMTSTNVMKMNLTHKYSVKEILHEACYNLNYLITDKYMSERICFTRVTLTFGIKVTCIYIKLDGRASMCLHVSISVSVRKARKSYILFHILSIKLICPLFFSTDYVFKPPIDNGRSQLIHIDFLLQYFKINFKLFIIFNYSLSLMRQLVNSIILKRLVYFFNFRLSVHMLRIYSQLKLRSSIHRQSERNFSGPYVLPIVLSVKICQPVIYYYYFLIIIKIKLIDSFLKTSVIMMPLYCLILDYCRPKRGFYNYNLVLLINNFDGLLFKDLIKL